MPCRDMITAAAYAVREHRLVLRNPTDKSLDLYAMVDALASLKRSLKVQLPRHLEKMYGPDRSRREEEKLRKLSLRGLVKDRLEGIKVRGNAHCNAARLADPEQAFTSLPLSPLRCYPLP